LPRLLLLVRELQSEPAAIECAAAEPRGGRVLVLPEDLLNPIAECGGGVFVCPTAAWR